MKIKQFTFNPWQENCFVVYDQTNQCAIIDAGCYNEDEYKQLTSFIDNNQLEVKYILNTHLHIDHILGNYKVCQHYNLLPLAHKNDKYLIADSCKYAPTLGITLENTPPTPNEYLKHNQILRIGNFELLVLFVPGHTPGSVAFYNKKTNVVIVGDVLFNNSVGRTDLEFGDFDTLENSIKQQLYTLPNKTKVLPGHGPFTDILTEKTTNPFIKED